MKLTSFHSTSDCSDKFQRPFKVFLGMDKTSPILAEVMPIQFKDHSILSFAEHGPIPLPTTLSDVLHDKAPRPYTAKAFVDFVSCRHSTELLDFLVKAEDYHDLYVSLQSSFEDKEKTPQSVRVGDEWKHLMGTFISTGSPEELNLPWHARNQLLNLSDRSLPPRPDKLNFAIHHIHETLTSDILLPFLRSCPLSNDGAISPRPSSQSAGDPYNSQNALSLKQVQKYAPPAYCNGNWRTNHLYSLLAKVSDAFLWTWRYGTTFGKREKWHKAQVARRRRRSN